jgi:hypothetical protein
LPARPAETPAETPAQFIERVQAIGSPEADKPMPYDDPESLEKPES